MNHENPSGETDSTRRAVVGAAEAIIGTSGREIVPVDGSVERSGDLVSVFCGQCQRWIHCYDRIEPEIALHRHVSLMH
jgi:hypothetical protein